MAEQIVEEKKILRFVFVIRVIVPYERGYETSGSPLRFMLRRSSLVECVTRKPVFTKRRIFFSFDNMFSHVC